MKPNSPGQLARFLDQVSGLYPNGIPTSLISAPQSEAPAISATVPYHLFIVGSEPLSQAAKELLAGITSKGLRISTEEYSLSHTDDKEVAQEVANSLSERVIVFGASRDCGFVERSHGLPALFTQSLEAISSDAALKKGLWRDLQRFLTPS